MPSIPAAAQPLAPLEQRPALARAPLLVMLLLALLLGLQPLTTDLYLPALPALKSDLAATIAQVQLTFTGLLLAFGGAQLVWGPVSDRFGRRPVLLAGLALYLIAALAAALASSAGLLVAARLVQGAALGAPVMCARAIVRDLYPPLEGAHMFARGLTGLAVLAVLAVPLGSLATHFVHWRAALSILALFSAATLALVAWRFTETLPTPNPRARALAELWRANAAIARHPTFLAYSLLTACTYSALVIFLTTSPFVFMETMGLGFLPFSVLLAANALVYLVGTVACRRLLRRLGMRRSIAIAGAFSLTGGALMAIAAWWGPARGAAGAAAVFGPQMLFMLAHGVHQAIGQSGSVAPFPRAAGTASALNGFFMMAAAFAAGQWLSHAPGSVRHLLGTGFPICCAATALIAWTLVQRHGEPERA